MRPVLAFLALALMAGSDGAAAQTLTSHQRYGDPTPLLVRSGTTRPLPRSGLLIDVTGAAATPAVMGGATRLPTVDESIPPTSTRHNFSGDQASAYLERSGYTNVTSLRRDSSNIWRGQASRAGRTLDVAVDEQGNIAER